VMLDGVQRVGQAGGMRVWGGLFLAGVLVLGACSSDDGPAVLQELDATVGGVPVHVTYDDAARVCSAAANDSPVCQSVDRSPAVGIQRAQLDATSHGKYVLRMLVSPGVTFDGLPTEVMRMGVAMNSELVLAVLDSAPACFRQSDPDGQTHDVTVNATQVDTGSGVTAVASTESAC
jgi:hypothetical protein